MFGSSDSTYSAGELTRILESNSVEDKISNKMIFGTEGRGGMPDNIVKVPARTLMPDPLS